MPAAAHTVVFTRTDSTQRDIPTAPCESLDEAIALAGALNRLPHIRFARVASVFASATDTEF